MSNLIDNIKRLAGLVKNETRSGANSAARIGGLFEEIGVELEQKYDRSESDQIMTTHNTADVSHRNIQDKIEGKITGVSDQLSREVELLNQTLSDSIKQKYETLSGALDETNNNLSGHIGNQEIHRTSQQIRAEITDADIPATLARIADVNTKDSNTLATARQYSEEKVAEVVNNAPANLNTLSELAAAIDNDPDFNISINTRLNGKADKSHSHRPEDIETNTTNRFITDAEKAKLAGIAENANNYVHPATHPATMIIDDAAHRFTTDAEKALWNSKAAGDHSHTGVYQAAGDYAAGSHIHTAGQISEDTTHRFTTDAEKATWNSKADGNHDHDSAYLKPTGDGQNVTAAFTQASTRTNITSGEKLSTLFGKMSRWFTDLKTVAFTGSAADITEQVNKRFMTDAERTKVGYLSNVTDKEDLLQVVCAGSVSSNGTVLGSWGKKRRTDGTTFTVTHYSTGVYYINHNLGYQSYGFSGSVRTLNGMNIIIMTDRKVDSCTIFIRRYDSTPQDDEFDFLLYKLN